MLTRRDHAGWLDHAARCWSPSSLFGTLPFWIGAIGLYPYLGIEVLIWCIFALGFNVLLGYTGLPSFGHGAYFGIGAYAMGLAQFNLVPNLWFGLLRGDRRGGGVRRHRRRCSSRIAAASISR